MIYYKKGECNGTTEAGCVQASQLWRWSWDNYTSANKNMGILENKGNIWKSFHLWKFVPTGEGDLVRIEKIETIEKISVEQPDYNSSTESYSDNPNDQEGGKFIEIVYKVIKFLKNPFGDGDQVQEEDFEEDVEDDSHFWKKGETNADGYFTLETPKGAKVLTADSKGGLEIKGNFG